LNWPTRCLNSPHRARAWRSGLIIGIIPSKPYTESKTRLAACLSPAQRMAISRTLLLRTLRLARPILDQVVAISRDRELLREAELEGAHALDEVGNDLNSALTQAARFALAAGALGIVALPADLPLLTAEDIQAIVGHAGHSPAVVIAPCQRGTGTNALLMRPPLLIAFSFGTASFMRHCAAAAEAGVQPTIYHSPTVAFDLDTPDDWQAVAGQFVI
jgi:2-phospho-L-lactate/phosphoenolpyruvate guanylyltransferase